MAKWFQRLLPALAFAAFLAQPARAQVEGPVETGLAQLTQQIVTKSAAAGKTAVAVLPFPNSDGSCSVLSNFIADELIQNLFSVPGSQLEIVERSQLETLISELRLGASGLLNPETTKKLGSQSGVSALTVGTITVIGDTVRINARLIATDTGRAISAAAVDIPKVAAVSELLKQPVTTGGPTCAPRKAGSGEAARAGSASGVTTPKVLTNPTGLSATAVREQLVGLWQGQYTCGQGEIGLDLTITDLSDDGYVKATFSFYNLPGRRNSANGSYSMVGHFDPFNRNLQIQPESWIKQPPGYMMVPITSQVDLEKSEIIGTIDIPGCGRVHLVRRQ